MELPRWCRAAGNNRMMGVTNLIILGATARAAAFSARRAGMRPWCVDLFADADLARAFPGRRVALDAFPAGLMDALADPPDCPVMFTGRARKPPRLPHLLQP